MLRETDCFEKRQRRTSREPQTKSSNLHYNGKIPKDPGQDLHTFERRVASVLRQGVQASLDTCALGARVMKPKPPLMKFQHLTPHDVASKLTSDLSTSGTSFVADSQGGCKGRFPPDGARTAVSGSARACALV